MTPRRSALACVAFAAAACARPPEPPRPPASAFSVTLERASMPMARIGGRDLLVDSGATVHAIRAQSGAGSARVRDAHGAALDADRLDAPIGSVAGPWFAVAGLPVAGVLSPQAMLAFGQAAELDLRGGTLRVHDDPRTAASLVAAGASALGIARCGERPGPLYTVEATIAGERARLLVDSGSARTSVLLRSSIARRVRKWPNYPATVRDPSGGHDAWVVLAVPVAVARFEVAIDMVVTDDQEPCDVDGALGVDVLGSCDVILMRASGAITCG